MAEGEAQDTPDADHAAAEDCWRVGLDGRVFSASADGRIAAEAAVIAYRE